MKFEIRNNPVLTGEVAVSRLLAQIDGGKNHHISSVKTGIPCLIMNKKICNANGIPFESENLQAKFRWISNRLDLCKIIGIGRIVHRNDKTLEDIAKYIGLSFDGYYKRFGALLDIELEDIVFNSSVETSYAHRLKIIEGFINSYENTKNMVSIQAALDAKDASTADVMEFILKNDKMGYGTFIKYNGKEYGIPKEYLVGRNLSLFEIINGRVKRYRASTKKEKYSQNKEIELLESVIVDFNGKEITIDMNGLSRNSSIIMLKSLREGRLTNMLYRATIIDGIPTNPKPI